MVWIHFSIPKWPALQGDIAEGKWYCWKPDFQVLILLKWLWNMDSKPDIMGSINTIPVLNVLLYTTSEILYILYILFIKI